jgi:type IV secretory pathway VirB10-like protein
VLKPLLLGMCAVAVVGVLMLGGWALTGRTPDAPPRQAPASGVTAEGPSRVGERAGTPSQEAAEVAQPRVQQDAVREDTRVRDLARRAQQRSSLSGVAGQAPVRRRAGPRAPSLSPAQDAAKRRRAAEAARLRAERRAQDERTRRMQAAARAEEAEEAADRARNDADPDEPEAD